ncbi:MAG: prolyl-tRNA synthetase associated domain-containing protein [Candidatus Woesearchaeota archaeon]
MGLDVKKYLKQINISFIVFTHPPVYTVEQAKECSKDIRGVHSKNLFLKNKHSTKFYLVIIPDDQKANMKELGFLAGDSLTFASERNLKDVLGLTPGAVSPFGLINNKDNAVELLIHKAIWESKYLSFHPNINTETLELKGEDFHRFVELLGIKYYIV